MNIITCHLGNGSSITAVKGGKCFDTSMGMTPLAGVMMGTRSGDIDPAVVLYLLKNGFTADEIDALMNKKGGVLGLSNTGSSDMRDLWAACEAGNEDAKSAVNRLIHSYAMYVGGYVALLGRVDAIVLTGGIGENSFETRAALLPAISGLGVTLNAEVNAKVRGVEKLISGDDSSIPVYVIPTNEELMIARETHAVVTK
jgi:acetate kinase